MRLLHRIEGGVATPESGCLIHLYLPSAISQVWQKQWRLCETHFINLTIPSWNPLYQRKYEQKVLIWSHQTWHHLLLLDPVVVVLWFAQTVVVVGHHYSGHQTTSEINYLLPCTLCANNQLVASPQWCENFEQLRCRRGERRKSEIWDGRTQIEIRHSCFSSVILPSFSDDLHSLTHWDITFIISSAGTFRRSFSEQPVCNIPSSPVTFKANLDRFLK